MITYEIHSGCGARQKITAASLTMAKRISTNLGYGICTPVWIRDESGRLLAKKECKTNSKWR